MENRQLKTLSALFHMKKELIEYQKKTVISKIELCKPQSEEARIPM